MITLKYWNPDYKIGLTDWKTVYYFPQKELMIKEMHQGDYTTGSKVLPSLSAIIN